MSGLYMDSQAPYEDSEAVPKPQNLLRNPCIKEAFFLSDYLLQIQSPHLQKKYTIAKQEASIRVHKNQYYHVSRDLT